MTPHEAEARLRLFLEEADVPLDGAELDAEAPRRAWEAFRRFAAMPVEGMSREEHSDALLFQAGYQPPIAQLEPAYFFGFTRQFIFHDDDGEYDGMEQLSCTFHYEPAAELQPLGGGLWSFDMSLEGFYEAAEAMPAFRVPLDSGFTPVRVTLHQHEV